MAGEIAPQFPSLQNKRAVPTVIGTAADRRVFRVRTALPAMVPMAVPPMPMPIHFRHLAVVRGRNARHGRDRRGLRSPGNGREKQSCDRHRKNSPYHCDSSLSANLRERITPQHGGSSATINYSRNEQTVRIWWTQAKTEQRRRNVPRPRSCPASRASFASFIRTDRLARRRRRAGRAA
jgi:hypothetical protein